MSSVRREAGVVGAASLLCPDYPSAHTLRFDATPEPGALTIHFVTVPEFFTEKANNFSIRLDSHGNVTFNYLGVLAQDGLVGITPGGGATDPGPSDLSRFLPVFPKTGTTYELFTPTGTLVSPFDLPFRKVVFK